MAGQLTTGNTWHDRPVELLQRLLRFDTTNPPGDEAACIAFIERLLCEAGFQPFVKAEVPGRPNLLARLEGRGSAPPLLLYGHVDVVPADCREWQHGPFDGDVADGFVWGRGALDMKGGIAMMLAALLRAKAEKLVLPGDVLLAIVSNEEAGGDHGAKYLVEHHADFFRGVRYAIGEFGGFALYVGKRRFYPIMVAEKQSLWMRAYLKGPGGHGAMPVHGGALAKLATLLSRLERHRLPVHVTPVTRTMLQAIAAELPFPARFVFRQLANPRWTNRVLGLLGQKGRTLDPLLRNTVCPTTIRAGEEAVTNVIPREVWVALDARILPGYTKDDLLRELRAVVGDDVEFQPTFCHVGPSQLDMGLFDILVGALRESDPEGVPIPMLLSGSTDGRLFSRLGIQTYGYLPMPLPPDFQFAQTIHAANERIPVAAVDFGANTIYKVLQRFGDAEAYATFPASIPPVSGA